MGGLRCFDSASLSMTGTDADVVMLSEASHTEFLTPLDCRNRLFYRPPPLAPHPNLDIRSTRLLQRL